MASETRADGTLGDRVFGVLLLILAVAFGIGAFGMQASLSYDPLGPRAFPLALSVLLGVLSLVLIARPGAGSGLPGGQVGVQLLGTLAILAVYAVLFTRLGFLVSTVPAMIVLSRVFGATRLKAAITGVVMTFVSYALFVWALGIVLPAGSWFGY